MARCEVNPYEFGFKGRWIILSGDDVESLKQGAEIRVLLELSGDLESWEFVVTAVKHPVMYDGTERPVKVGSS